MSKETLKVFNELIDTVKRSSTNNEAKITNVKLWAESWKKEIEEAVDCNSESENAICLKTYPDEDDMVRFANGQIKKPEDVKINYKGKKYKVNVNGYDEKYYKLIDC